MALQTADVSCPDESGNIYVDCGNGTITDNRSGLIWLKDSDCFGLRTWLEAMTIVSGLSDLSSTSTAANDDCGLSDGSSPGEWRLPSASEWESMIAEAIALGCTGSGGPSITNDAGNDCYGDGSSSSFINLAKTGAELYWSSTVALALTADAWFTVLDFGFIIDNENFGDVSFGDQFYIWPVRGGQ